MNLDEELEYLESKNKMINLNRARQNTKLAVKIGMNEDLAKSIFYKDIIDNRD